MEEPLFQNPVAIFLTVIAVILIAPLLFERFRLPGIVGLIIGGIIIGPHGLNLLSTEYTIETLAIAGLVYLMFSVGLEIDLRQFRRVRNRAISFGILTFSAPMITGILLGRWLGFKWDGSVLLGAVIASHALINYPILRRLGILRNDSVSAALGATVFTDISALLVLAYVVRTSEGDISAPGFFLLILILVAYTAVILIGVPRLGKIFFNRFKGRAVEFQFILVVLFGAALVAELIDMHIIVGAFLAGLAINSTLPSRSPVVNRVLFLGEAFFIPLFLIYIGMIIDPATIFTEPNTLFAGWMMTMSVYLSKLIPAWIVAILFRYSRDELFTVWGISQAQATTTLAILLVGVELGILSTAVFNGGVMMVMVTCITSSIIVQYFGSRLAPSIVPEERGAHYERILVSLANPQTQEYLMGLASILARHVDGKLFPVHITLRRRGEQSEGARVEEFPMDIGDLDDHEDEIEVIHRVDTSVSDGIVNASIELKASMIVMGWHEQRTLMESVFGSIVDQVLLKVDVPILVGRITTSINAMKRLVLVVPCNSLVLGSMRDVLDTVIIIATAINVPMLILSDEDYLEEIRRRLEERDVKPSYKIFRLGQNIVSDVVPRTGPQDLVMVTTLVSKLRFGSCLGNVPEQLAESSSASLAVFIHPTSTTFAG
jgi:Kef-type K+ transport system membrane component KefB/nucleotide-binding universal stress UspA family protein